MKKIYKTIVGILLVSTLMFSNLSVNANAASISRVYSGQFTSSWSKTYTSGQATIEYGFNTVGIKEDNCYAHHSNESHYAKILNGAGVHSAKS